MARHNIYAVNIDGTLLKSTTDQRLVTGSEVRGEPASGEPMPRHQTVVAQKPTANFTTLAIEAALTACGPLGANIADWAAGLIFYAQKRVHGGSRETGANHRSFTLVNGMLLPQSLSCEHQGDAQLSYEAKVTWDGTNDPFQIADSVALPSLGAAADDRFTLGPVSIGGYTLAQKTSVQIEFGIKAESEGADSDIWDRNISIDDVQTKITIKTKDIEALKAANVPLLGKAGTHANTSIQFYKRSGSSLVAGITLTGAGYAVIEEAFTGQAQGSAESTLVMSMLYDGTNNPLVVS